MEKQTYEVALVRQTGYKETNRIIKITIQAVGFQEAVQELITKYEFSDIRMIMLVDYYAGDIKVYDEMTVRGIFSKIRPIR